MGTIRIMDKSAALGPRTVDRYVAAARHAVASVMHGFTAERAAGPHEELLADRGPVEHAIDCAPEFFRLFVGDHPATEIRHHNAVYRVGDRIRIRERVPDSVRGTRRGMPYYTGRECVRVVVGMKPWNRRTGLVELTLDGGSPDA